VPVAVLATVLAVTSLSGCGPDPQVTYEPAGQDVADALVVLVGPGPYRQVLEHVVEGLPATVRVELVDAPQDAAAQVVAGEADLVFAQDEPSFEARREELPGLSVVARAGVVPYALYSSRWTDLQDTTSWVNAGIVEDEVVGQSLPHGSRVVLPGPAADFARGLYLLQDAGLVLLDRPFGGTEPVDLAIDEANVVDSLRHLSLLALFSDDRLDEVYRDFDALVLAPEQAALLGLDPATDALAVEPGPGNPYAQVLVAPSRLAGDPRVLALTHALEDPEVTRYLASAHPGSLAATTTVG